MTICLTDSNRSADKVIDNHLTNNEIEKGEKEVNSMPRGDKTGPQGQGAATGRGQGGCNPRGNTSQMPQQGGRNPGRGQGAGQGLGRGQGAGRGQGQGQGLGKGQGAGRGRGNR